MSAYWKTLFRVIRDESDTDKYESIIIPLYCIVRDYQYNGKDDIYDEEQLQVFERLICINDPEWALCSINDTTRCSRCRHVIIKEDNHKYGDYDSCESCYDQIQYMADEEKEREEPELPDADADGDGSEDE